MTENQQYSTQFDKDDQINPTVLVVDDDVDIRCSLSDSLVRNGWDVHVAESGKSALAKINSGFGDIVISDINMPGMDGITLIRKIHQIDSGIEVLITTGFSTENSAIEALKAGAVDYIKKPFDAKELLTSLRRVVKLRKFKLENSRLKALVRHMSSSGGDQPFIAESQVAKSLLSRIEKIAASPMTTVLLLGESGVGKEVAARLIHKLSRSPSQPFVAINCGGVAESLLESELFGHEKGAFTGAHEMVPGIFELAGDGTVLLDEISDLSMSAQTRLLRVLEERTIKRLGGRHEIPLSGVRIIGATNRDLKQLVSDGLFRKDLYYRISVTCISINPLRERVMDILPVCRYFLEKIGRSSARNYELTQPAMDRLLNYDFPGNIRELRNIVERATIFANDAKILDTDLELDDGLEIVSTVPKSPHSTQINGECLSLDQLESHAIQSALSKYPDNLSEVSRRLGISLQALYRRMDKYNLR